MLFFQSFSHESLMPNINRFQCRTAWKYRIFVCRSVLHLRAHSYGNKKATLTRLTLSRSLRGAASLFGGYCLLFGRRIFPSELLTAVLSGVIISVEGWASGTLSKARDFSAVSDVSEGVMSCLSTCLWEDSAPLFYFTYIRLVPRSFGFACIPQFPLYDDLL